MAGGYYQTDGQVQTDPIDKLYQTVHDRGLYTKSLDEFKRQYSSPDQINKLYSVVKDQGLYSKTPEEFTQKYFPATTIPKIDLNKPVYQTNAAESVAHRVAVPQNVPRETMDKELAQRHQKAMGTLQQELQGNQDVIPDLIKKQKEQAGRQMRAADMAMMPRSDQPLTAAQQQLQQLQPNTPQPVTVSDQEVQDYHQLAQTDQTAGRAFLQHVVQSKPEKANSIKEALYLNDAMGRVENNPQKTGQVLLNAKKIAQGKLDYHGQSGMLTRPENAIESISTGLKQKNQAFADYDTFTNLAPQDAIQELEKRRQSYDPDQPVPVPENFAAGLTGGMAGQPLKGLVAGKVAGAGTSLAGGAEFAPAVDKFITAAVSGNDFRKMTYAHSLQQNYNQLRNEGLSPEEAYQKANGQAKDEAMVDALSGAAMMYGAGAIGDIKLPNFNLSEGFTKAVINGAKQGIKGVGEAGAVGLIQGVAEDAKNKLAQMKGIERKGDIGEAIKSGTLFTLGMAAIAKGSSALSGATKATILQVLSKADPKLIDEEIGHQLMQGVITPDEAVKTKQEIDDHRTLDQSIPENVTDESRAKIQQAIKRRKLLEIQLESEDAAFHPGTKEKIKAVNEQILALSQDKKPRGEKDMLSSESVEAPAEQTEPDTFLESRHADTVDDEAGKVSGPNDNSLSKEGKKDANDLAEEVKDRGVAKIITSDLERAKETGKIVGEKTKAKIEHDPALNTWDIGDFDKTSDEEFKKAQEYFVNHPDEKEFEGKKINETFNEYKDRIIKARTDLENEPKSTLVVNHSNNMMLWDAYVKNGHQWNEQAAKDYLNAKTPEPATLVDKSKQIAPGDTVISPHFEGPQRVMKLSEDGKSIFIEGLQDHHVHEIPISDITLKNKQNARTIRSDQGQIQEGGNAPEGSQETRSNDIQLNPVEASGDAKTEQSTGQGKVGSIPPEMLDLPFEPEPADVTRLAHADTEKLYEEMGASGRVPRATKTDIELENQADELIKNGYDFVGKAHEVLGGEAHFTDAEQVAFSKMVGAMKAKLNSLDVDSPEFDALEDKIELLSRASDVVGSEEGAAFRARRMFVLNDQTLSDYIQQDKESLGVDELTPAQKEKNKSEFDDLQTKQKDYEEKIAKLEEENAKLKADAELNKNKTKGSKKTPKKSHDEYVKERKSILEDMRADLLKAAKGQGGLTASVPGVAQLTAIAPHALKLAKSLAEEGYDKLGDVVKNIHGDLKDIVEGITEKDIHNIIAGEYNEKKPSKNALTAKMRDLKDEAALINKLEALQNGEEPKSEKKKVERNKQITDLRKQISDIQKAKKKEDKEGNTFYTEPKSIDAKNLASIKKANEKELNDIHTRLKTGEFGPEEKKVPWYENKQLKEKNPQAFADAMVSRDLLEKAKSEREVRILKQQYANRSKIQKGLDFVAEVGNTPRSIMSSLDFSAPLRQGIWGVTKQLFSHPGDLGRQFSFMFKAAKSQKVFDRWFADLKDAPDYEVIKNSGLPIADPHDPKLTAKEEAFMSNLAEKIPIIGKAIKGSENAYVGFLNKMRVDIFRRGADGFLANGKTFENSPELYKAFADYVGAATGRGKMPEVLEKSAPILNSMFFSPRLIASRLNLLTNWANPRFYTKVPKDVRVQYFKDMAKFIGTGLAVLALAKAGGADVEDDPRSSDFGKIKSGNTRWDIWGGFQQYVRLAAQLITGEKKSTTTGNISELNGQYPSKQTRLDALISFGRAKLAPLPGEAADLLAGKDVTGKPVTLGSEALKNVPLVLNDITEAYQDKGVQGALMVGIPSMFGVGVQTYQQYGGGSGGGSGATNTYEIKEWK